MIDFKRENSRESVEALKDFFFGTIGLVLERTPVDEFEYGGEIKNGNKSETIKEWKAKFDVMLKKQPLRSRVGRIRSLLVHRKARRNIVDKH